MCALLKGFLLSRPEAPVLKCPKGALATAIDVFLLKWPFSRALREFHHTLAAHNIGPNLRHGFISSRLDA